MNFCQVNCSHSVGPAVIFTSISRCNETGNGKCQCVIQLDERLVLFSCCSALWWVNGMRIVWTQRHSARKTHQHKHDSYLTLKSLLHTLGVNGKEVHPQITTLHQPFSLLRIERISDQMGTVTVPKSSGYSPGCPPTSAGRSQPLMHIFSHQNISKPHKMPCMLMSDQINTLQYIKSSLWLPGQFHWSH